MQKIVWTAFVLMTAAACGGHSSQPKPVDIATRKDAMCSCKDKTCAAQVNPGYSEWRAAEVKKGETKKPELVVAYETCWSLAMKDEIIGTMTTLRDQACACKDAECSRRASKAQADWGYGLAASMGGDPETDPSVDAALLPITAAFDACADAEVGTEAVVARIAQFRDEVCACTDKACAQNESDQLNAWNVELAKRAPAASPPDETQMKAMTDASKAYADCAAKLMTP
ncbi:hypothetical protein BH11MYX2_BH11MYX2_09450 [soil metagenome]